MKHFWISLLILGVSNVSFSQENTTQLPSGKLLKELKEEPVFRCHPNPVDNQLFVIGTHKIKSIEIIDILGKNVRFYQFDKSIIRLNVSQLQPGIYLLKVIDKNEKQEIKKLIVK